MHREAQRLEQLTSKSFTQVPQEGYSGARNRAQTSWLQALGPNKNTSFPPPTLSSYTTLTRLEKAFKINKTCFLCQVLKNIFLSWLVVFLLLDIRQSPRVRQLSFLLQETQLSPTCCTQCSSKKCFRKFPLIRWNCKLGSGMLETGLNDCLGAFFSFSFLKCTGELGLQTGCWGRQKLMLHRKDLAGLNTEISRSVCVATALCQSTFFSYSGCMPSQKESLVSPHSSLASLRSFHTAWQHWIISFARQKNSCYLHCY